MVNFCTLTHIHTHTTAAKLVVRFTEHYLPDEPLIDLLVRMFTELSMYGANYTHFRIMAHLLDPYFALEENLMIHV